MLFRIEWSGCIVLIKSEILIMTGMVWLVSSDKWKAPLLPYAARYWTFSLRASSPIWASEASRPRTRQRVAKPREAAPRFRVSSRVPLARLPFTLSPKWSACSQATGHLAWKYKRISSVTVNVFVFIKLKSTLRHWNFVSLEIKTSCLKNLWSQF